MKRLSITGFINALKTNKKRSIIILLSFIFVLYMASYLTPGVKVTYQIHDVTDQDFNIFANNNVGIPPEKKTRENCRFLTVSVKISKPFLMIQHVRTERDTLKDYLYHRNSTMEADKNAMFLGEYNFSGSHNFSEGIDVYLDGMTEEALIDYFKNYKIEVTWFNLLSGKNRKIFYLRDYLK